MDYKGYIQKIGFLPKDNAKGIFYKKYPNCKGYIIEIDLENSKFNFGKLLSAESKTTQNFFQAENWVVLECVNRLLEKGYQPQNIKLEKTWATGHGTSGRLDILVTHDDGTAYMMIECKTFGVEFDKGYKKILKDGGQLFTYFQQDKHADILMLYASEVDSKGNLHYKNEIVKIEDDYRLAGNVKDFYDRWNKLPKNNGVFDDWVQPYDFKSKALTPKTLKEIKQADSSFIFNRFLEILRHNVVSDKPNAFNKIFTLFLCKIYDEKSTKNTQELAFQWLEGIDNHISFQKRLTDLYRKGMKEFLEKEVSDLSDQEFEMKFSLHLVDDEIRQKILDQFTELRLKKNNEFAIKEVFDDASFEDNAKVVKEVVELLQGYKIRYTKRHQYLSDFFELLLTTGLKQESGQFFTPVPVAQFVIKSIPLDKIVLDKLNKGEADNLLPAIIDYAAGSGHFLTESMHEVQRIIDKENPDDYIDKTAVQIKKWQLDHFDWAIHYVYGIEKDYRLVKVGKVGCYLHGDGLAKVIHGDGLANFTETKEYQGKLKARDKYFPQENKQFDIVISNPPYSVSAFKGTLRNVETEFNLYNELTDQSSQIECLFIERTKQLLKDGGIAGIILPSSILSNTGIYTRAREIILQYFDIIAIAEFGSNTFMATGTNTVTLFLRRRKNEIAKNIRTLSDRFVTNLHDVTINGIETPVSKYVSHVWDGITYTDYITLIQRQPNEAVQRHEIYKEYQKKIVAKTVNDKWNTIIEKEQEKLFYFILAYPQRIVLVKSGEKNEEKQFLGYEFSNRRGSEGIHPVQRGKSIDECTQLFDPEVFDNPEKASTYIYKAFQGNYNFEVAAELQKNISRSNLVDMLTFDRTDFEKSISLSAKKKVNIESKWNSKRLSEILLVLESGKRPKGGVSEYRNGIPSLGGEHINIDGTISNDNMKFVPIDYFSRASQGILEDCDILICKDGALTGKTSLFKKENFSFEKGMINEHVFRLRANEITDQKYLFYILHSTFGQELLKINVTGTAQGGLNRENLLNILIPHPPLDIQQKIVAEISALEEKESNAKHSVEKLKNEIRQTYYSSKDQYQLVTLSNQIQIIGGGTPSTNHSEYWNGNIPWLSIVDFKGDNRFVEETEKKITEEGLKNSSTKYLDAGDIIISARGTVGALAQLKRPMTFNQSCYGIKANANLVSGYLYYALKFEIEQFKANAYGSIFDAITTKTFDLIKIPLPSLKEQQKIVSQIELIEDKIAALENEIASIPQKKEAILKKYL